MIWKTHSKSLVVPPNRNTAKLKGSHTMRTMPAVLVSIALIVAWTSFSLSATAQGAGQLRHRAVEARRLTRQYERRLQNTLIEAIRSRGWRAGVNAYRFAVREISDDLAAGQGIDTKRVALKRRSPASKPDNWEKKVLKSFAKKADGGADINALEQFQVVINADGSRVFRYMRGIAVAQSCLACHGTELKVQVRQELTRHYPDDEALGLKVGQLYGAFSLKQPLD